MTPLPSADPISLFLVLAAMAVLPFAAMVVTSYTKIAVVLGLLRNAIGVQQVPPNMVLNGVAMIVSCYVMAPVLMEASEQMRTVSPGTMQSNAQQIIGAADAAREPLRRFLDKHADAAEKAFFLKSAAAIWPPERAAQLKKDDLLVLAPAFLLTELTAAFRIGFLLYLAFIVIDLVIANVLLAMGLSQVTPTNVAIPFKLLLFVVLDGWSKLIHGLVLTYR
ncbi:type III secretion system protein YscR [Hydrogenophaga taeniospiralis CCUG 15921]|uniref:Type III secretion system protein YscR n=1 Tax=Hydrogenophaga taeniospiralis CCUG 15921 TaxID=1281780 RepID=A0A9X4NWM7_9BURK|nr:type III secretion system export apparatus subunit SctR [Hydrogenophaga taeniospiralis]MDG5977691.1 type III secretion system protein YscR [Hydrogenophaga taeniospiralis CCUG 15921]